MFEKNMHVCIVTKCDWSLRTYKHVAWGMWVCTMYIYTIQHQDGLLFFAFIDSVTHVASAIDTCW